MSLFCAKISEAAVHSIRFVLLHQPAELAFAGGASLQAVAPAA
jgi:hypothetical protein